MTYYQFKNHSLLGEEELEEISLEDLKAEWKALRKLVRRQNVLLGEQEVNQVLQILEHLPKEEKHKNNVPTVIQYKGRRFIFDVKGRR